MELFTVEDLSLAISAALMSNDFKIIEYKFEKVYNFGDTKMGSHYRIVVMIEHPDDVKHSMSFFSKFVPENEEYKSFVRVNDCFSKEAYFYSEIASIMKTLLPSEIPLPVPMCYFIRAESMKSDLSQPCPNFEASAIILQDLHPLGYHSMDTWTLLDLQHCRMVMRALAIFHGGSVLLQDSKTKTSEHDEANEAILSVNECVFISNEESLSNQILHACTETTATVICHIWPVMYPMGTFYDKLLDVIWNSWQNVFNMLDPLSKFACVICHGELCGNNILFAYEREQHGVQKPVDVKFIDMQLLRYAPPVTDILMFLHVCTSLKFRSEHFSELLSYYYVEFVRAVSPKVANKITSLEILETSVKDMQEFGLMTAIYLLPLCLTRRSPRLSGSFHISDLSISDSESLSESRRSSRRYSSNDAAKYQQDHTYSLLENQAQRILEAMEENPLLKMRLLEAYEEYLKFVGLWEDPSSNGEN